MMWRRIKILCFPSYRNKSLKSSQWFHLSYNLPVLCRKNVEISSRVYVGGIPYYSTEDDIRSYFEGCGTITSIDCMTFPDTGKFRGIAIISFKVCSHFSVAGVRIICKFLGNSVVWELSIWASIKLMDCSAHYWRK